MSSWLTHTVNVFCPFTIFCSVFIYCSHDFLSNVKIKAPKFTVCMLEPLHVYFLAWPQMTDRLILLQLFMNFHSQIWLWWYFQVLVVCRWISFSLWLKAKQHIQSCSVASPQEQFSYLILKYLKSFFVCFLNIKNIYFIPLINLPLMWQIYFMLVLELNARLLLLVFYFMSKCV